MPFPPGKDLFQLLWTPCSDEHLATTVAPQCLPVPKVFWRKAAEVKNPIESFPAPEDYGLDTTDLAFSDAIPRMCSVHPERVIEYPDPDDLQFGSAKEKAIWKKICDARFKIPKKWQNDYPEEDPGPFYFHYLSRCPGAKVSNAKSYQDDNGKTWELLMVIPSWEFDAVSGARWQPLEDRNAGMGPDAICPTGLTLGRTGNANLWVCRELPGWPINIRLAPG